MPHGAGRCAVAAAQAGCRIHAAARAAPVRHDEAAIALSQTKVARAMARRNAVKCSLGSRDSTGVSG